MSASEPEVTTGQRAYLDAFDRWLRDPSPTHEAERTTALAVISSAPSRRRETRVDYEEQPVEQIEQRQPRPVKVVVAAALQEIRAREARVERIAQELPECRAARRALERLLPAEVAEPTPPAPAPTPEPIAASAASGAPQQRPKEIMDRKAAIYDAIVRFQPVSVAMLVQHLGLTTTTVNNTLATMQRAGMVLKVADEGRSVRWCVETAGDASA